MTRVLTQQCTTDDYSGFLTDWSSLEVRLMRDLSGRSTSTVLVGGDVCLAYASRLEPDVFGDLLPRMRASEATVINLECPLTVSRSAVPKSGPRLVARPDWASVLRRAGVDAVGLANNHVMDAGPEGLLETIDVCEEAGLRVFGGGRVLEEARAPVVLECENARVAFVAVAEHESGIARESAPGAAPVAMTGSFRSVRAASADADVVVALVHGGCEHYPLPSPRLRDYCHLLVTAGADVVLCQHSHAIGAIETVGRSVVSYGTGNLLFPYPDPRPTGWYEGLSLELEICSRGVASVKLLPHRFLSEQGRLSSLSGTCGEGSLSQRIAELNSRVASAQELQEQWRRFVLTRRRHYLATLLGLTRPERLLLRAGLWPAWRMPRRMIPMLLNVVSCESHNEATTEILSMELDSRG